MLLAFACAGPAWSQAIPAGKRWQVQLEAGATYDSNVAKGGDFVAAARQLRKGEFTYSPNANINISQPLFGQGLFLQGNVGYVFHQYNKDLQSERVSLSGGVQTGYGPCGLQIVGGYASGQSDLAAVDLRVSQNNQHTKSIGANLSCNPLSGIGVTTGYTYAETRNSSDLQTQDSHNESASGGITYTTRLLGTVSVSGNYGRTGYDNGVLPPNSPFAPQGFEQYGVGVSIARPIGTRLTGQAQISYTEQNSDGAGQGFSGLTGSGALTYRVNPRLVTHISYSRGSSSSSQQGASFVVDQTGELSFDYRLSQRLHASVTGHASRRSYRGQTVTLPTTLLSDDAYGVSSSLSLTVGRNSSLGVSASYDTRNAKPSIYDYSAYRVGVSVSTTF